MNNKNLIWKKSLSFNKKILEITHSTDYVKFVENSFPKNDLLFLDGEVSCSGGFSNPSRVPKTFFSLRTKKMAIPAKTRISIIAGLISRSQSMR